MALLMTKGMVKLSEMQQLVIRSQVLKVYIYIVVEYDVQLFIEA